MKVAIYGQFYHKNSLHYVKKLLDYLEERNIEVAIERDFLKSIYEKRETFKRLNNNSFINLDESFDLLISLGGDGTILRAITFVKKNNIPIVGINTGRLGFLATIQKDQIEAAMDNILKKNYKISERTLLSIKTLPQNDNIKSLDFALNEITVSRKNTTSMITVETYLNNEYLNSYWADGLIVASPTGSTGYSLSCGGPVITPESNNFVITPIAPHNLNARPLVISDDTEIKLKINGREETFLVSLDSRIATLDNDTIITIKKADFTIKMIELYEESFLVTLRKKLLWGEDKRN